MCSSGLLRQVPPPDHVVWSHLPVHFMRAVMTHQVSLVSVQRCEIPGSLTCLSRTTSKSTEFLITHLWIGVILGLATN